jgi:hypothetical protein
MCEHIDALTGLEWHSHELLVPFWTNLDAFRLCLFVCHSKAFFPRSLDDFGNGFRINRSEHVPEPSPIHIPTLSQAVREVARELCIVLVPLVDSLHLELSPGGHGDMAHIGILEQLLFALEHLL